MTAQIWLRRILPFAVGESFLLACRLFVMPPHHILPHSIVIMVLICILSSGSTVGICWFCGLWQAASTPGPIVLLTFGSLLMMIVFTVAFPLDLLYSKFRGDDSTDDYDNHFCFLYDSTQPGRSVSVGSIYIFALTMGLSWSCLSVSLAWLSETLCQDRPRSPLGMRTVKYMVLATLLNTVGILVGSERSG